MDFTTEDLESNPFFVQLQTNFPMKYNEAQKNLWLICVPTSKSLKGVAITKEFVDIHVLRPSPFFKSHYITTDDGNTINIEIEDLSLKSSTSTIRILMEETAYNENYKPYKILLIERPLSSPAGNKNEILVDSSFQKGCTLSLKECSVFLSSFVECSRNLEMLDKKLQAFISSYMILPQYLQDAIAKLHFMIHSAIEEFLRSLRFLPPETYSKSQIEVAVENYVLCNVHDKLFPVIKKYCLEEDKTLTEKLFSLYDAEITPDQLGITKTFCCQTPRAVVELASLNSFCSPAEKFQCLMMTLELLKQDVEQFLSETYFVVSSNKASPHLTSDDLIPLLANIIIQARPQYFVSNLYYVQKFCWKMSSMDKFSFGLVTFQAAKEFLMSHEFDFPKCSTRKVKKELSLKELMEATIEFQNNAKFPSENRHALAQSPIDYQLENVTKMIEASTREQHSKTEKDKVLITRQREQNQQVAGQENLGDFITSLQQKSLGLTYGKQT